MLLVPPFHVIIIADSSFFVKDQLANFGLFFLENIMNTKICSKCKMEKDFFNFKKDKTLKCGYFSWCRSCLKEYKNKNHDMIYNYNKEYYSDHKDIINKNRSLNNQKRRLLDLNFKITSNLRTRLSKALTGKNKSLNTMELLGCDIEYLIKYIEDLFLESMSWDNYGKWHIDHILPCASFDLTNIEQQKICFNYKNLQPLWAEDNIRKGAKIIDN